MTPAGFLFGCLSVLVLAVGTLFFLAYIIAGDDDE